MATNNQPKQNEEPNDEKRLETFVNRDFSKNKSNMITIIIIIVVVIALAGGGYFYYTKYYNVDKPKKLRKDTSVMAGQPTKPKSPPKSGEKLSFVSEQ